MIKKAVAILAIWIVAQLAATAALAGVTTGSVLEWDASEGTVTGYRVYYGVTSGTYTGNLDVGTATSCQMSSLPLKDNTTYYFTVRAYNDSGESGNSNELSWVSGDTTPPLPPQSVSVE